MVARMVRDHKVVGSNPVASTKPPILGIFCPESGFFYALKTGVPPPKHKKSVLFKFFWVVFWVVNRGVLIVKLYYLVELEFVGKMRIYACGHIAVIFMPRPDVNERFIYPAFLRSGRERVAQVVKVMNWAKLFKVAS